MDLNTEWFLTKDKLPTDSTNDNIDCIVLREYTMNGKKFQYIELLVFNGYYKTWDDYQGDDHECDLEEVIAWSILPNINSVKELFNI